MGIDPDETDLSVRAAGRRIAGFELVQRIDADSNNAFGEVWLAHRLQPFQRVAIKFLRRDRVNEEMVERFSRAESKALARFNHPYIARFYELGFHGPVPYLVMQYVPGDRITAYADAHGLSVAERLRLMAKVCDAVQHVHLQGVVHRDLKPANIMVSESRPEAEVAREGDGRAGAEEASSAGRGPIPVLIDFGLAKSSNPDAPLSSAVVSRAGMAGSPAYASPEQIAARNPEDTGQPADIYALGAVLFELVAGVSPMEHVLSDTTLSDLELMARLAKDDRPSMAEAYARLPPQRQEAIARARGIGVPEMRALLRSRLAHLTDRALRQDPKSRFSDARAFALDIGNYLAERDYLEAAAEPRAEKWRRAVRRNRGVVAAVGAVVLALVAGFGTAVLKAKEAADARDAAEAERDRANNLLAAIAADSALQSAQNGRYEQLRSDLKVLDELGQRDRFDVRLAVAMSDQSLGRPLRGHEGTVTSVSFSPDGRTLASSGNDRTLRLWDVLTLEPRGVPLRGHEAGVYGVMFSPDGRMLASASVDMTVRMWDVSTGKPLGDPLRGHTDDVTGVAFSPDGQKLASASHDSTVRFWDVRTRVPLGEPLQGHEGWVYSVSFSPDGQTLASAGADGTLRLWDVSTGKPLGEPLRGHVGQIISLRFSPDGQTLVSGSTDETVRLWDSATGRPLGEPLHGHERPVICVSISGDSRMVASAGADKTVRLWDVPTGEQLGEPLRGHEGMVWSVSLARDGQTLASGSEDATVRVWDVSTHNSLGAPSRGHESPVACVSFTPNGRTLASASWDTTIRLWDELTCKPLGEPLRGHESWVHSLSFSPDGRTLASGSADETIRLWDASTGKPVSEPLRGHDGEVTTVSFSPVGQVLASGGDDETIRLWDAATGRQLGDPLRGHEGRVSNVCFSPNGLRLASGGEDGTIRLWDASTGLALGKPLRGHEGGVASVCFSPDGRTLASAGSDSIVRLWNPSTAEPLGELLHEGMIVGVCFSPDGRTLASGSLDGTIRLWDAPTCKPLGKPLRVQEGPVLSVCFSPDGRTLASGSADETIRLWHTIPMRDRIGAIRTRLAQVDSVRTQLQDQIADVGIEEADVSSFHDRVLADPRFAGDLRTAALIVVGEVGLDRQAARTRQASERAARTKALKEAQNAKDWAALLALLSQADPADIATLGVRFWNEVAWMGLTELPADSPARDLTRLLSYAERAVELSERKNAAILDTLARAHWELGDKQAAISVQEEAVRVGAGDGSTDESRRELADTLERYRSTEPPRPPGG